MWTNTGKLRIGRYRGVPLYVHWSLPVAMVLLGRFELVPIFWLAIVALILVHEAGHAALIRQFGMKADRIMLHGLGGDCQYVGAPDLIQRIWIAWGGVLAQLTAYITVSVLVLALGTPDEGWLAQVVDAYTRANLWLIALNLIPLRGFDGHDAWKIFGVWRAIRRHRRGLQTPGYRFEARAPRAQSAKEVVDDVNRQIADIVARHNSDVADDPGEASPADRER